MAALAGLQFEAQAQDYHRIAPKVPSTAPAPTVTAPIPSVSNGVSTAPLSIMLGGIVFVAGNEHLVTGGVPNKTGEATIDASQVPELDDFRFKASLKPFLGRPISLAALESIRQAAVNRLRAQQRPFVDISVPPQSINNGVVQFVVTQYKLGKVNVTGARYFSDSLIKRTSRLQPGQLLDMHDLQTDLDRLNQNPFLGVNAVFSPGSATGQTDVTLNAKDRLPLRFYGGYDNLGVRTIDLNEYNFGANWGNVFNTGQVLSYQLTRSFNGRYTSHSLSDTIPLPWGDQLLIFGSYEIIHPFIDVLFRDVGHSGQASIRYVRNLRRTRSFTHDLQIGYDFKTTDNNLEFSGLKVFGTQAELDQFPLIYDATLTDRLGETAIQNNFVFSPGNITANNTTDAISALVPGAQAQYVYDRFLLTRTTRLPAKFSSISRISLQVSNRNLAYSEQLGGGGVGSVRGYYTNTALGSQGFLASQEFRTPSYGIFHFEDNAQFGAFFDYAHLTQNTTIPYTQNNFDLSSLGIDAHYLISRYLAFEFDLGWRLRRTELQPSLGAYGQVSLTVSY